MPKASAPSAPCVLVWRVAADDRHARQRDALFRADDVHDALARIGHGDIGHAERGDVVLQRVDLQPAFRLGDALAAVLGRHVMVGDGDGRIDPAHLAAGEAETFESLGAGDLMHEMAVDIKDAGAVLHALHHMRIPDLVEQSSCHRFCAS